jgi:hypothetical protein
LVFFIPEIKYLAAWTEILALGVDTLVVVNVVLPAVLGPEVSILALLDTTADD